MSGLIPSSARAASLGCRAVRYYAAAALKPAPESEPSSALSSPSPSSEAGPSRPRSSPTPSSNPSIFPQRPRVKLAVGSEESLVDHMPKSKLPQSTPPQPTLPPRIKPSNPTRQAAVRRAKAFARDLKARSHAAPVAATISDLEPSPMPMEAPTLDDLFAKRPPSRNMERTNPKYPKRYKEAAASIDNAFTQKQLVQLVREMGWISPAKKTKRTLIPELLKHWGWEKPVDPKPRNSPRLYNSADFDLETADVFLLLRDDPNLQRIMKGPNPPSLTILPPPQRPEVQVPKGQTPPPSRTILRVTGSDGHLDSIRGSFAKRQDAKDVFMFDTSTLGDFKPSPTLINALSSLYGCYVEIFDRNILRLSCSVRARNQRAVRLLVQAASRHNPVLSNHFTATILPGPGQDGQPASEEGDLNLSPFCPSSKGQLPWDVAAMTNNAPLTRLRRNVIWEAKVRTAEGFQRGERIEKAKVWRRQADGASTAHETLGDLTRDLIGAAQKDQVEEGSPVVTITFGHFLKPVQNLLSTIEYIGSPTPTSQHPRPSQPSTKGLYFVPSATPCMVQHPLETASRKVRRLRYRCFESGTEVAENRQAVFTWEYPTEVEAVAAEEIDEQEEWQEELDSMLVKAEAAVLEEEEPTQAKARSEETEDEREEPLEEVEGEEVEAEEDMGQPPGWVPMRYRTVIAAEIHSLSTANLRLPDRPIDAHLAARSVHQLPPLERLDGIREFFRHLETVEKDPNETSLFLPPPRCIALQVNGTTQRFMLLSDEVSHITEIDRGNGVILRTVKSVEPRVAWSQPITHTELEYRGAELPDAFWTSFAEISREVPPSSGILKRGMSSY